MPKNKLELTNILKSLIKLTRENTNFNKAIYAYKMLASINFYKKKDNSPHYRNIRTWTCKCADSFGYGL